MMLVPAMVGQKNLSNNPFEGDKESELDKAKREIKELKKENQKNRDLLDQRNKLKKKLEEQEKYSKDLKTKNEVLKSEIQIMKSIRDKRLVNSQSILIGPPIDQSVNVIFSAKLKAVTKENKVESTQLGKAQRKRGRGKDRGREHKLCQY